MIKDAPERTFNEEPLAVLHQEGEFDVAPLAPRSILELDKDIKSAIQKMKKINEFLILLPGLNCSACGSPSCYALAEDIVQGHASIDDCVVLLKRHTRDEEEASNDEDE